MIVFPSVVIESIPHPGVRGAVPFGYCRFQERPDAAKVSTFDDLVAVTLRSSRFSIIRSEIKLVCGRKCRYIDIRLRTVSIADMLVNRITRMFLQ